MAYHFCNLCPKSFATNKGLRRRRRERHFEEDVITAFEQRAWNDDLRKQVENYLLREYDAKLNEDGSISAEFKSPFFDVLSKDDIEPTYRKVVEQERELKRIGFAVGKISYLTIHLEPI